MCSSSARAVDRAGSIHVLSLADLAYTYRHCGAPDDLIFTEALYQGTPGDPEDIARAMQEVTDYREANQPTKARTGGSTFKNPPGHSAWKLIDAAGCRGLRIGGAHVSEMHCNFLINDGEAQRRGHRNARRDRARPRQGDERHRAGMGNQAPRRAGRGPASGRGGMSRKFDHVAVLMGGWSAEREVSLNSGKGCAEALESDGYRVTRIDVDRAPARAAARARSPMSASTRCTARAARTAPSRASWKRWRSPIRIPACWPRRSPCTRRRPRSCSPMPASPSPSTASCRAWKPPRPMSCRRPMSSSRWRKAPASASSSCARITPIRRRSSPPPDWSFAEEVMVERYIAGRELTCAVMGDRPLGVIEILPAEGLAFYDYRSEICTRRLKTRPSSGNFTKYLPLGTEAVASRLIRL